MHSAISLSNARTDAEVLAAAACFEWWETHRSACPDSAIPTEAALAEWLHLCPVEALDDANDALRNLIGDPERPGTVRWLARTFGGWMPGIGLDPAPSPGVGRLRLMAAYSDDDPVVLESLESVHALWRAAKERHRSDPRAAGSNPLEHPLGPILREWQSRSCEVEPERRADRRLLPVVRPGTPRFETERGMVFGGLIGGRQPPDLPLTQNATPIESKSVAILDLADASGLPVMSKGRGAPLVSRLFVRAALSVRPEHRRRQTVRITLTIRELRDGLFPKGWQAGRDWPRLRQALIGAHRYTIPDGTGGQWFMLALRRLPAENARGLPNPDDRVVLDLAFPPGADSGPPVDLRELDLMSVTSAARWRAYIAAMALAWIPGRTQRPVPGRRGRYGWSRDPADYPVLTQADRRRLAFGRGDRKHRTQKELQEAWSDLPGTVVLAKRAVDPTTGEIGWRIVPADAAEAMRKHLNTRRRGT